MQTDSGLQYIETEAGTGKSPKRGQRVSVHYIGRLENGKEFDNSVKRAHKKAAAAAVSAA